MKNSKTKRNRIAFSKKVSLTIFGTYLTISGMCYVPQRGSKEVVPNKEFIEQTYFGKSGKYFMLASENRKQQLLREIRNIRNSIKQQAQSRYYNNNKANIVSIIKKVDQYEDQGFDKYLQLRSCQVGANIHKHSLRLIENIFNNKNIKQ